MVDHDNCRCWICRDEMRFPLKTSKLKPNTIYHTYKKYESVNGNSREMKGTITINELDTQDVIMESISVLIEDCTLEQRLKVFSGLGLIYMNLPKDSPQANGIAEVASHYCHECGEVCHESVDEEHDERYIVCTGGSHLTFKDRAKGLGNSAEEMKANLTYTKPNECSNRGWESDGISHFVKQHLLNAEKSNQEESK